MMVEIALLSISLQEKFPVVDGVSLDMGLNCLDC